MDSGAWRTRIMKSQTPRDQRISIRKKSAVLTITKNKREV